ncbi:MAG TPA: F0F1 ATP synthase subunit epsilon [Candidatus Polarisedimenticolia bacterium]|nr:F0F1 ATP synthase subunit epsilon [Candidatus Polarisedimenticolia bacterium]
MIHLTVVTPERKVVDRRVDEVVLPGVQGYLGVLPGHAPLLTSLTVGEITYRQGAESHFVAVAWGFVEVHDDQVSVLADVAERAEEIDLDRARRARDRAAERLRKGGDMDWDRARAALDKAIIRIRIAEKA